MQTVILLDLAAHFVLHLYTHNHHVPPGNLQEGQRNALHN